MCLLFGCGCVVLIGQLAGLLWRFRLSWYRSFTTDGGGAPLFSTFYVTNTVPTVAKILEGVPPFVVLNIAELCAQVVPFERAV